MSLNKNSDCTTFVWNVLLCLVCLLAIPYATLDLAHLALKQFSIFSVSSFFICYFYMIYFFNHNLFSPFFVLTRICGIIDFNPLCVAVIGFRSAFTTRYTLWFLKSSDKIVSQSSTWIY